MKRLIKILKNRYLLAKDTIVCKIKKPPTILDNYQTIDKIINGKCSISRFGDGELFLLSKKAEFSFQKKDDKLSKRLEEVLRSNEKNLLIGIPKIFSDDDLLERTEESRNWWKNYLLKNRLTWYKYLDNNKVYANSTFTRNYIAIQDKNKCAEYFKKIQEIWNREDIVIIEGEFSRLGVGNGLFDQSNSIQRILAPNENAFDKYEAILNEAIKIDKNKLILIALGPTATILAYDLHKLGYRAIDIGHLDIEYEWFLQGATTKVGIKNKYTFETNNLIKDKDNFYDEQYNNEIIKIIK